MERLLDLPDWGTRHFLDVAEYALATSVALDWLDETWAPPLRQALVRSLVDKALRPSFEADAHALRWLGGRSNWTQVCHADLAAAALAVADQEPELAARWRIFRLGHSAHNILRFNGTAQDVGGTAPLRSGPGGVTLDLTPLYRKSVSSASRQASLQPDDSLRIEDHWATGATTVEVANQWLTYATVETDSEGALLLQEGRRLRVRVESPPPGRYAWRIRRRRCNPTTTPCRACGASSFARTPLRKAPDS
jgi:hypothetical protein